VLQIFKEEGLLKREKSEVQDLVLFQGVQCSQSLFIFSKTNKIRITAYKLTKHPLWENTVLALICLSSLKLATDTYMYN
jgi:hypothetical protein